MDGSLSVGFVEDERYHRWNDSKQSNRISHHLLTTKLLTAEFRKSKSIIITCEHTKYYYKTGGKNESTLFKYIVILFLEMSINP